MEDKIISDTVLIFGGSDRILQIEKQLPELLKNNHTIGLNVFPLYYKTDYWLWIDNPAKGNCVYRRNGRGYKPYFAFEPNIDLMGGYTVASFALDFAAKAGYKKAILYGILDGEYVQKGVPYQHAGHMVMTYRHFYGPEDRTISMLKLQQFKAIINSYRNKIEVEIPYGSV